MDIIFIFSGKVMSRLTLDLSKESDRKLNEIIQKKGMTKAEVMRRALDLFVIANDQEQFGNVLAIVKKDNNEIISRLIGI
jgi:hypothetical protein